MGEINSIGDVLIAAGQATSLSRSEMWWRGQPSANWGLVPAVYRNSRGDSYERNISLRFRQKAETRHHRCPPPDDWPAWLFFMQHYKLPTRLLDWTQSPLIATYFAVKENPDESGAIWALHPYQFNKSQTGSERVFSPDNLAVKNLFPPFPKDSAPKDEIIVAIYPREVDIRMMIQMSAFTIHGTKNPLNSINDTENFLVKHVIPPAAKRELENQLFRIGITESYLFPDLEHLASELASMQFDV